MPILAIISLCFSSFALGLLVMVMIYNYGRGKRGE